MLYVDALKECLHSDNVPTGYDRSGREASVEEATAQVGEEKGTTIDTSTATDETQEIVIAVKYPLVFFYEYAL